MTRTIVTMAAAALVAGCGGEQAAQPKAEKAGSLQAGEYEISQTVADVSSTDNTTPATKLKAGAPVEGPARRICVGEDGRIDSSAFAEGNDECGTESSYSRAGKLSMQLRCVRPGNEGPVMQTVDGNFTADSFEAQAVTTTYFIGTGDYRMTRQVTGRRVGDCPADASPGNAG
ncbi:MAG TPA: DUF3617 family protein [Sphingomicrobium sp.]|jgi:hypothetical protein|nr:DUF3617 family protein [Sphingomicrobium sp.]